MSLNSLFKRWKSAYMSRVKHPLLMSLALFLVAGGCYNPSVKNGGFACSGPEDGQCPSGFFCVNGLCQDLPSGVGNGGNNQNGPDLSRSIDDMATGENADLSHLHASIDMANGAKPDLSLPPDMTTLNSCAHNYCTPGSALDANCDPCVKTICAKYANCCTASKGWTALCVSDVKTLCTAAQACP